MIYTAFLAVFHRQPAPTGPDRHKTGTDRPGFFNDVFDKNFQNIVPIWAI
jgi:hypothetical protein